MKKLSRMGISNILAEGGGEIVASLFKEGLVDIAFNLQNGGYTKKIADTIMNLVINSVCISFGPILIWNVSQYITLL